MTHYLRPLLDPISLSEFTTFLLVPLAKDGKANMGPRSKISLLAPSASPLPKNVPPTCLLFFSPLLP